MSLLYLYTYLYPYFLYCSRRRAYEVRKSYQSDLRDALIKSAYGDSTAESAAKYQIEQEDKMEAVSLIECLFIIYIFIYLFILLFIYYIYRR